MRTGILWFSCICLSVLIISCKKDARLPVAETNPIIQIPEGFPPIVYPKKNKFSQERWLLGKKLFFDNIFSDNQTISCASCHHPQFAFSDTVDFSIGSQGLATNTNAPSLANVAYHPYYLREGGVPTLEIQAQVPVQEHNEFNTDLWTIVDRAKQNPEYVRLAKEAYDREFDPFVLVNAVATFERSLLSGNSRYDQYKNNKISLSQAELNGMNLFFSTKTNCLQCHGGFNFTNYAFENNGLYTDYKSLGRNRLTHLESDLARFKTPSLRNVGVTAPYMHDGSLKTLEDVVRHYNSGGVYHKNKSQLIKPLGLTEKEINELVVFLHTLTDEEFLNNKLFRNEK